MKWLVKMDAVLKCLYEHSGDNPKFSDLQNWLKNKPIDKGEIQDITLYLWREQMMYFELNGLRTSDYDDRQENGRYLISCKGKLFLEDIGGFQKQAKNTATQKFLQSLEKWLIVAGTMAAGIYGAVEAWKFFF